MFFPVSGLDKNKDGRLDYVGVRARVNLTAGSQVGALFDELRHTFREVVRAEGALVDSLAIVLARAPDVSGCATALTAARGGAATAGESCGTTFAPGLETAAYDHLRDLTRRAREQADAKYFGLDLRLDVGDPTLGAVPGASGTSLLAGIGFGRRFGPPDGATAGMRGRLGVRYVALDDTNVTDFAVDGGVAFEATRPLETQRLDLSAGVEFRFSGARAMAQPLQTRFLVVRGSLTVPLADATSLSVSFSAPLVGSVSPTLSINANWHLLLAGLLGAGARP